MNKASDNFIKEQASDMVFTEEQLDRIALANVRARAKVRAEGAEEERAKNEAANNRKAEFLRANKVPEDIISAMLAIK